MTARSATLTMANSPTVLAREFHGHTAVVMILPTSLHPLMPCTPIAHRSRIGHAREATGPPPTDEASEPASEQMITASIEGVDVRSLRVTTWILQSAVGSCEFSNTASFATVRTLVRVARLNCWRGYWHRHSTIVQIIVVGIDSLFQDRNDLLRWASLDFTRHRHASTSGAAVTGRQIPATRTSSHWYANLRCCRFVHDSKFRNMYK